MADQVIRATGRRFLFLDIDGVLNSAVWFEKMRCDALARRPISHMIDPDCVARLNGLLDAIGAEVVVSSSWRIVHILGAIDAALKAKGFTGKIIDKTPHNGGSRGNEIQQWLTVRGRTGDQFIILDDDSDMGHLAHRHVCTSWGHGLTERDCERALALFTNDAEGAVFNA